MAKYRLEPLNKLEKLIELGAMGINPSCIVTTKIAELDKITSKYNDEEEFKEELKKFFELEPNEKVYIWYMQEGRRTTRPMYKTDEAMLPFIEEESVYVSKDTPHFQRLFLQVLKAASKERYMDFMEKNGFIQPHMLRLMKEYNLADTYDNQKQLASRIGDDLTSYKALRNMYIGTKTYEKWVNDQIEEATRLNEINEEYKDADLTSPEYIYLNEMEQDLYEVYKRGGLDEVRELTEGNVPINLMKKINAESKRR